MGRRGFSLWLGVGLVVASLAGRGADWQSYFDAGVRFFQRGDYRQATVYLLYARRLCPFPNPSLSFWLGRAYYKQGSVAEALDELERARFLDPSDPNIHLWLGYAYVADGRSMAAVSAFRQVLALVDSGGLRDSAVQWLRSLHEPPELTAWEPPERFTTSHFIIKHFPGDVLVPALGEALEEVHRFVLEHLGLKALAPVEVLVFRDLEEYRAYHQRRGTPRPEWSVACSANGRIFSYQRSLVELRETVAHEYTHIALHMATLERPIPCWLDEGLAALVANQYGNSLPLLQRAYAEGLLLNVQELQVPSFSVYPTERAAIAYGQSRAMTEWFLSRFGRAALMRVLEELGRRAPPDAAFRTACRYDQNQLLLLWIREVVRGGA